jgi:hypothetical protein
MSSVIFRRANGQHFIVFLESVSHSVSFLEKLDMTNEIQDFEFWAPLESFADLISDEERMVGSSPSLQVLIKHGHAALKPTPKLSDSQWPEHFVVVSEDHIVPYLRKNHTYRWAPGKCNGVYDHLGNGPFLHDIRNAPETYGFSPALVSEGAPLVFLLGVQDDFWVRWGAR